MNQFFKKHEPWMITLDGISQFSSQLSLLDMTAQVNWNNPQIQQPAEAKSPIAVVRMHGTMLIGLSKRLKALCEYFEIPITDTADVAKEVKRLTADDAVKVIVLDINSSGGRVTGTPELGEAVRAASRKKYVYAYSSDLACSAAYWVASKCDGIYAAPSAKLGSIGVILPFVDTKLSLERQGIIIDALTAGKYKGAGMIGTSLTDDHRAKLQESVDTDWALFKQAVLERRSIAPEHMEGQCFSGLASVENGLADGIVNDLDMLLHKLTKRHRL